MSFQAEKCCHLLSAHAASARRLSMQQRPPVSDLCYVRAWSVVVMCNIINADVISETYEDIRQQENGKFVDFNDLTQV